MSRLSGLRRDWRFVMALMTSVTFVNLIAYVHFARFLPLFLRDELGVAAADVPRMVGLVTAAAMLTGVPLAPIWGPLSDRYSRKWMILRSSFVDMASYGLTAFSGSIWTLFIARLIFGFAHGSISLMLAAQSLVTPREKVGMAMGVIQAMFPLAACIAPPLGAVLIKSFGLRGLLIFDTILVGLGALLLVFFMEEPPGKDTSTPFGKQLRQVFVIAAEVPAIRWSFILQFFMAGAQFGLEPFLPIAVQRANATSPWGWDDPTAIGITLGVNGLITAILLPFLGRLTDRVGAVPFIVGASLVMTVASAGLVVADSLPVVWGWLLLLTLPQAAAMAAAYAFLGMQTSQAQRSGVLGLTSLPRNLSFFVVPTVAGVATGLGFGAVFVVGGVFLALSAASATRLHRLSPKAEQPSTPAAPAAK